MSTVGQFVFSMQTDRRPAMNNEVC